MNIAQGHTDAPGAPHALAHNLIAASFSNVDGSLAIGGVTVEDLATTYGTPCYVYDANLIRGAYRALRSAVEGFADVVYSIKANPNPEVCRLLVGEGAGLEIASDGERVTALAAGCVPERIIFAGPGKGPRELEAAIAAGIGEIHLETFEEIELVAGLARQLERVQPVAIRVNPIASSQGGAMRMGGKPAAFGFDEEILADVIAAVAQHGSLDLAGLHMFAGTQILDAATLRAQWRHALALGARLGEMTRRPLRSLDLGGGLGVPYHEGDRALDLAEIRRCTLELNEQKRANRWLADAQILLEPGRYLVAGAGIYLMAVRAVKLSRGERFVICDGGMHHHLAASGNLGQVIKRDYPLIAASRLDDRKVSQATVVGPLCTPLDTVGRKTPLPTLTAGDLVAILQSGAYGLTASPVGFLSHDKPAEVLVDNGLHRAI